jgi:DNA invertase Pin-like site-specific DNA recombinase
MTDYASRRGWMIVAQIEEIGSGASLRPRREELLRAARRREIDAVLVWRLDRWGRSLVDLITTLKELSALGVGFVSITEALDLTTPSGRAMAGMLAVFFGIRARDSTGPRKGGHCASPPRREAPRPTLGVSKREIAKRLGISRTSVRRGEA